MFDDIRKKYDHHIGRFLDGPEWFYVPTLVKQSGKYRSPTLAAAAWLWGYYLRYFTVPGRFMAPTAALVVFYSTITLDSPVRMLSISLMTLFGFDFVIGWFFRPRLNIQRHVPERVRAGTRFRIAYSLSNLRRFTAWDVELDNYKLKDGIKWLSHGRTGAAPPDVAIRLNAELEAIRRGKYVLHSPIADSRFPFGIFKRSCRKRDGQAPLLVYPAFAPLNSLILPVGLKYQKEGISRASKVGESMDFFGTREFREGDDPRHIDWPGSARTGEIVIKEFHEEYLSRIALIVDTFVPRMKSFRFVRKKDPYYEELESALSLTAALTDYLTRGEYIVDIFAAGTQVYHLQAGRHLSCFDSILDILACLEPNNEHPISRLSPNVCEEISGIGSAMLILLGWDKEREELVDHLRGSGTALKCVVVGKLEGEVPEDISVFTAEDVKNGRVRDL